MGDTDEWRAKYVVLKQQIDLERMNKINAVSTPLPPTPTYAFCDTEGHKIEDCNNIALTKDVMHLQWQSGQYAPTSHQGGGRGYQQYNNWRNNTNNTNNTWRPNEPPHHFQGQSPYRPPGPGNYGNPPVRPPEPQPSETDARLESMERMLDKHFAQQSRHMEDMSKAISDLVKVVVTQRSGQLPAQPEPCLTKQIHFAESDVPGPSNSDQVNSVTVLRSGKTIPKRTMETKVRVGEEYQAGKDPILPGLDIPFPLTKNNSGHLTPDAIMPPENLILSKGLMQEVEGEKIVSRTEPEVLRSYTPSPSFPKRLAKPKASTFNKEVFDTLQQVKINIPLLDTIKQIPSYAKFLKELCTVKRKLNVKERTFLTEAVGTVLDTYIPVKCKDSESPTVPIVIGDCTIGRALLDLGASVNLLSFSVYEQLGLGELKTTLSVLQMADRSIKVLRGIIEDLSCPDFQLPKT